MNQEKIVHRKGVWYVRSRGCWVAGTSILGKQRQKWFYVKKHGKKAKTLAIEHRTIQVLAKEQIIEELADKYPIGKTVEIDSKRWIRPSEIPDYVLSDHGDVKSFPILKTMKSSVGRHGYKNMSFVLKNCERYRKTFKIHRLVAKHFVPNDAPESKIVVDHVNSDKLDNFFENLEWVTHSENTRRYWKWKNRSLRPREKFENSLPNEEWRHLSDSIFEEANVFVNYEVSSLGRVKEKRTNILMNGPSDPPTYTLWNSQRKKSKTFQVGRLILMAFNAPREFTDSQCDHIDNDYLNNCLSNLHWATRKENMNNSTTKQAKRRKISVTHCETGEVEYFSGLVDLSKKLHSCTKTIRRRAEDGKPFKGKIFKFALQEEWENLWSRTNSTVSSDLLQVVS